uniref:WW domain-containing protein n=1 Tax=Pyramimonas obovata TaxID=1411642 RepID=A0A7S0NBQ9_9CHLO|mmetsp:Transcript_23482/g.51337  ORF Transcript_23482/g.51337 Transcript_23482/m.51337 type:complete len:327 (+) Transcript_23482:91-1071(+)
MGRGVFFDDYEDFKHISEKVESEQAEFVACWPPPQDPKDSTRRSESNDSVDEDSDEEEVAKSRLGAGDVAGVRRSAVEPSDESGSSDDDLDSDVDRPNKKRRRRSSTDNTALTRSRDTAHRAVSAQPKDTLWQAVRDPSGSGDVYYWNVETGKTSWDTPEGYQPSREPISGAELASNGNLLETDGVEACDDGKAVPTSKSGVSTTVLKDKTRSGAQGDHVESESTPIHDRENESGGGECSPKTGGNVRGSNAEVDDGIQDIELVEPSTDQERALIVKTAKFVAEKGNSVENKLLDQKKSQFGFLEPSHSLHGFYRYQVDLEGVAFW